MALRNFLFNNAVFTSRSFEIPTLGVGNLSVGGTGKTPHVKFLVEYFSKEGIRTAVLSRGYGRKTKGFILVEKDMNPIDTGDEPLEIKLEFPSFLVAVCESRVKGMEELTGLDDPPQLVILDDAFQHRWLKVDHHILLTTWRKPYFKDFVLPAGRLREFRCGRKRAQTVIVTKCPNGLMTKEKEEFKKRLKLTDHQSALFSSIQYSKLSHIKERDEKLNFVESEVSCLLFTGIANPESLLNELNSRFYNVESLLFPDHHYFSKDDLLKVKSKFDSILSDKKIIITTSKDATKLVGMQLPSDLPVYIQEAEVRILNSETWLRNLKKSLLIGRSLDN